VRILILPDAASVARAAADRVAALLARTPAAALGLAAGATPLAAYADLIARHRAGTIDLSRATAFGLDEYLGIGPDHPASCAFTLRRNLIEPAGIPEARVHLLDGLHAGDLAAHCAEHERAIATAGGIDLQILGLGVNGHIGFNEPGSGLAGPTRAVGLRAATRATNRPIFAPLGEEVPRAALTMGISTILAARRILLLATGATKADAVARMAEGPVGAWIPASALQLHPDATLLLDEAAAEKLALRDDYRAEAAALSAASAQEHGGF
jgi:glucosamine-6-phosphate deaminase